MTINHAEKFRKYVQNLKVSTLKEKSDQIAKTLLMQPYTLRPADRDKQELELEIINEEIERRKNEAKN